MKPAQLPPYILLDKQVGETPLSCAEAWRERDNIDPNTPLAYAGRLDPMASGKLLVLIGEECKNQTNYHGLDKAYDFSVLLGIGSDTHDVLGRLVPDLFTHQAQSSTSPKVHSPNPSPKGALLEESYPHFSAKTVQGKPLHMWTLEGRLDEIEIPTKQSTIYSLELTDIETKTRDQVYSEARAKIDTIPPVTEARKALGNDFRRTDVRQDWEDIKNNDALPNEYHIAHFHCIASSGTYMRTLAKVIGEKLGTQGLAWSIHRTDMGMYGPDTQSWIENLVDNL